MRRAYWWPRMGSHAVSITRKDVSEWYEIFSSLVLYEPEVTSWSSAPHPATKWGQLERIFINANVINCLTALSFVSAVTMFHGPTFFNEMISHILPLRNHCYHVDRTLLLCLWKKLEHSCLEKLKAVAVQFTIQNDIIYIKITISSTWTLQLLHCLTICLKQTVIFPVHHLQLALFDNHSAEPVASCLKLLVQYSCRFSCQTRWWWVFLWSRNRLQGSKLLLLTEWLLIKRGNLLYLNAIGKLFNRK